MASFARGNGVTFDCIRNKWRLEAEGADAVTRDSDDAGSGDDEGLGCEPGCASAAEGRSEGMGRGEGWLGDGDKLSADGGAPTGDEVHDPARLAAHESPMPSLHRRELIPRLMT